VRAGEPRARTRADIAIVGGGISGLALAFELSRRSQMQIVVLEQGYTGAGASSRNVGRIRAMQLTPELTRFALAAQRKHARLSDELGANTLFWRAGYAWVLYEEEEIERMAPLLPMFRDSGVRGVRLLRGRRLERRLPVLRGGDRPVAAVIGRDAIGHHDAVVAAYRRACERAGVLVLEGTKAIDLLREGDRVVGVRTREAELMAGIVVNATEGWSRELSASVGVAVPNTPVRREVFVTEPAHPFMREAITFYRPAEGWFNQTIRGELVAGMTAHDEVPGLNHDSSLGFLLRTSEALMRKAPRLGHLRVIRQWAGVYDMTPDRLPIVGPVTSRPGLVQMNGYSGRGFALAPLVAELLAGWLTTGNRPEALASFDPERFAAGWPADVLTTDYYTGYRRDDG
jgi:sarcosine oxidase subunit beta